MEIASTDGTKFHINSGDSLDLGRGIHGIHSSTKPSLVAKFPSPSLNLPTLPKPSFNFKFLVGTLSTSPEMVKKSRCFEPTNGVRWRAEISSAFPIALDRVLELSIDGSGTAVAYLQQQDDCFRREYGELAGDREIEIPWATEAIGCSPEAVNFWIGNGASETSFHNGKEESGVGGEDGSTRGQCQNW